MFNTNGISDDARESMRCLFFHGPTMDGDLPSKQGRDWLVEAGYADRDRGYNWLTTRGVTLAIEIGMGLDKEHWQRERRAA